MPKSSVAKVREAASPPLFLKTKLCKFFVAGKCKRGEGCQYAHEAGELRPMPDFSRTRLCPYVREQGYCPKGPACSFAHSPDELRARTPEHALTLDEYKDSLDKVSVEAAPASPVSPPPLALAELPPPPLPPAYSPRLEGLCGAMCRRGRKWADEDDFDGLDDSSPSCWSRQSTEGPGSDSAEYLSEATSEWGSESPTERGADSLNEGLLAFASSLGVALAVKNSFLDVDGDERVVASLLRRVRSTGDLLAAC